MKKWQKIFGCVVFSGMAIYEILIWINAYVDLKYIIEPNRTNFLMESVKLRFDAFSISMWVNYLLALILFIGLWKKGGKKCG